MRAHELIRQARERAGLSAEEVAARVGLSAPEYIDVETHPDEFIEVIAVSEARALCDELGLQLAEVVAGEPLEANLSTKPHADRTMVPRDVRIRQKREALGISVAELAFAIGFEDVAVENIEADEQYLDSLPIAVVAELAWKLSLPLTCLILATERKPGPKAG